MSRHLWIIVPLILLSPLIGLAAQTATSVHQTAVGAIALESDAQQDLLRWTDEREALAAEVRDMKMREAWLEFQNRKYARYIEKQEAVLAELERRKGEAKRIRMELEPFLENVVDKLEAHVGDDLRFLPEERARRIAFLRESLDDYRLELSEKLRRVLEALQVEAEYGRSVETTSQELEIDGAPTTVSVFRLGRTALFYQTMDGSRSGFWDRAAHAWRSLDAEFTRSLGQARDMAARKRAVELVVLPMGEPQ
ncbi:MAG: DUF3450 domain-containing protein [Desulfocurvibacter africanus]